MGTLTLAAPVATPPAAKEPFRTDIEGLRAIAVLTVLGFHAAVPYFGGGYVGVDVFFAISGFLITGLLLAELAKTGRISLADFYARRARRILPAAGVVLLVTAAASWLLLPPLRQRDIAGDVIAAAGQVANWRFIAAQTDYLHAGDPSPLLHYWSLAVEEQFYLLWAPLLLVAARFRFLVPAIVITTAASFALSLQWTDTNGPLAYLSSPTRAWQFGLGALAAIVAHRVARLPVWTRGTLGLAGLLAIAAATVLFSNKTAFPGTAALLPTLGAIAVLLSNAGPARLLAWGPLRLIGRLSFSWYLWHWPVLVLAEARYGALGWPVKVALVGLAGLLAAATLWLVERPIRFSTTISVLPRRGLAIGATAVALPVAAGLLIGTASVQAMRDSPARLPTISEFLAAASSANPPGEGPVLPGPASARTDYGPLPGECLVAPAATASPACTFGTGKERIVLVGDSHAAQWYPAVSQIASRRGYTVEVLTKQGCPLPALTVTNPQLGREYKECGVWRQHALERISAGQKPKLILATSLNSYTADQPALLAAWQATLTQLGRSGAPVAYLKATPLPGKDVPSCVSGALKDWKACQFPRQTGLRADPLAGRQRPDLQVVDVNDVLCPGSQCPAVIAGVLLYRDDTHLTNTLTTLLAPRVEQLLAAKGLL
ncbi:acyltransferase family protein [Longispora albida]|uniref:acyltransferase family protein n=1 Tax=Longispora albida TaxID=203523 RepID=UPI0003784966|nr:acyltransferase family protein [Longispora albida]